MRQVMIAASRDRQAETFDRRQTTTALDVHTQGGILTLMKKLNKKYKMGILFISHNLRVVKEAVQPCAFNERGGEIVEEGVQLNDCTNPKTAYTRGASQRRSLQGRREA